MSFDLLFQGKYVISGIIKCTTGLHIGGSDEGFEIGGIDNPVIRDPISEWPYIPGSSLKGKLRHLLEWKLGKNEFNGKPHHFNEGMMAGKPTFKPCNCGQCAACVLFGITPEDDGKEIKDAAQKENGFATYPTIEIKAENGENKQVTIRIAGPSRLTVRDSFPTEATVTQWNQFLGANTFTELKTENALDRVTAEANPRSMERVTAGSEFAFTMIFDVYRAKDKALLQELFAAMSLLEDSALGGSGTRGSGQIAFENLAIEFRPAEYYKTGENLKPIVLSESATVKTIRDSFAQINWGI
jgi:CRISPR-associated protein Csm3